MRAALLEDQKALLEVVKISIKEIDSKEARVLEKVLEDYIQLAAERRISSQAHRKVVPPELPQTGVLLEHLDIKK